MQIFLFFLTALIIIYIYKLITKYQANKRIENLNNYLYSNYFIETIKKTISVNKYNLLEERRRLKLIDAYGNEDLKKWIGEPPLKENDIKLNIFEGATKFNEGIPYFWLKVLLKEFDNLELFFKKWDCYRIKNPIIKDEILDIKRELERDDWYVFIASQIEKSCLKLIDENSITNLNYKYKKGIKFENECIQLLQSKGWKVKDTPSTGDQGVDIIASIKNFRLCIQCKDHINAIGNRAVQEIAAGKIYWKGTHAILISKSGFTKSAHKLATANNVILLNDYELNNIEQFIF